MHIVPNSEIKVVSNKTRGWSRAVVDVGVPYDENVDRALDVLRDEAAQFSTDKTWGAQLDGPVEVLGVESLSDSAVVLRTTLRTQPGSQWNVAREFRRRHQEPVRPREPRDSVSAAPGARAGGGRAGARSDRSRRRRGGRRMSLRLYNTLTRSAEPFVPLQPGRVSLYTCGPTVYNYAHIGNFRTFLFEDLLRRWLEASGYDVFHIMNLTDVDDRTIAAAREKGVSLRAHVDPFVRAFEEDRDWLRILPATEQPRATEYIAPMIELIQGLLDRRVAYLGEDGSVYFAIARFPAYGRLSQLDRRQLRAGASERVSADEYAKEDARDFVLWKAARPEDEAVGAAWDAPFGRGRPGWHIECSAMALELIRRRLGTDVLDIHAGGVDLIFPHHEDEIAQSCAYTGRDAVRPGLDARRVPQHPRRKDVQALRQHHHRARPAGGRGRSRRHPAADVSGALPASTGSHRRGAGQRPRGLAPAGGVPEPAARGRRARRQPAVAAAAERLERELTEALDDDLNAPQAVAALFAFASAGNAALDGGAAAGPRALAAWRRAEGVLGVTSSVQVLKVGTAVGVGASGGDLPETAPAGADEESQRTWALEWAVRRKDAKAARDFVEADRIRGRLNAAGWEVRDNRDGSIEVVRARR